MEDDRRRAFAEQMIATLTGGAMSMLVSVGYRTGLFDAAARGPGTSVDLAGRADLQERYVRETPPRSRRTRSSMSSPRSTRCMTSIPRRTCCAGRAPH
jgi:hypothetical protein